MNEVYNLKCHDSNKREEMGCCLRTSWETCIDLSGPLRQNEGDERRVTQEGLTCEGPHAGKAHWRSGTAYRPGWGSGQHGPELREKM